MEREDSIDLVTTLHEKVEPILLTFYNQFISYTIEKIIKNGFHIINSPGIRGIAKDIEKDESIEKWTSFLSFICEKHKQIGYVLKVQDEKDKNGKIHSRYYLKPSIKLQMQNPAEQLYGNVTLELISKNNNPLRIKCQTTYYSDRNFKEVRPFKQWMAIIFNNQPFNL